MEKKIQDYLHFYLGQDIYYPPREEGAKYDIMKISGRTFEYNVPEGSKIYLRPLSSMTEEEAVELIKITAWKHYGGHPHERKYETYKNSFGQIVVSWGLGVREKNVPVTKEAFYPEEITHLLSRGFDLFDLIPSGLAIDKTLQSHP